MLQRILRLMRKIGSGFLRDPAGLRGVRSQGRRGQQHYNSKGDALTNNPFGDESRVAHLSRGSGRGAARRHRTHITRSWHRCLREYGHRARPHRARAACSARNRSRICSCAMGTLPVARRRWKACTSRIRGLRLCGGSVRQPGRGAQHDHRPGAAAPPIHQGPV